MTDVARANATDVTEPSAEARSAAVARWCEDHDVSGIEPAVLAEAAARARVIMIDRGPAFDASTFADLVEFIAEMPF